MSVKLRDYQLEALKNMHTGCILCGDTGTGKSLTALAYYFTKYGGRLDPYGPMKSPPDLYIITPAKKRDKQEWEGELVKFLMYPGEDRVVIDSWNNIKKYKDVRGAFFIFDEQKAAGKGVWAKTFIHIAKANDWIMLSATPGDTWMDYVPVFIANGFYRNRTEFNQDHVKFAPYVDFPQVESYYNTGRLIRLRRRILVEMHDDKHTRQLHEHVWCTYDQAGYKQIVRDRWNYETDTPIETAAKLCYEMRKCVNSSPDRLDKCLDLVAEHKKAIIFYNYDYELEMLKDLFEGEDCDVAEWNGHKHQEIPNSDSWVYLVNYNAGAEGWNCITTDTIIFYSQSYSYKTMIQAAGRIDRLNTPYTDLYFYHLKSRSGIDAAISKALNEKKDFNESRFLRGTI